MQFLQANASLIFFALALVFMVWMHNGGGHRHGMGGGCGIGHQHGDEHQHADQSTEGEPDRPVSGQSQPAAPVAVGVAPAGGGPAATEEKMT